MYPYLFLVESNNRQHEEVGLVKMISENSGSSVFQRWNKKFLIGNQTTKDVDYRPMESLLRSVLLMYFR